ncbi:hypothetical protein BCR35DRAFT_302924 [Leucosporidium creatinivorum]|uniref:F-box domain-containing protein n=1 Tax=Leucosporidium creatinivorum TaxID=106004 RepID=A0A1Y2FKX9_9BASI|nr:hypothetical protein BCR35DRAFT_302924 [Leucosporidium creatinivorum]
MGTTSSLDYSSQLTISPPYLSAPTIHRLPPELLTRILKLTGDSLNSAAARHDLLKACSLVSRAWRDVAQKEVFRQIAFAGSINLGRFLKLLRTTEGVGGWVLELDVSWPLWRRGAEESLVEIVHRCDNVRRLRMAAVDQLPLFEVAVGSALRFMSLEDCTILKPRGPYPAPTVEHLSLTASAILGLKSPNDPLPLGSMPSVRALSVTGKLKPTNWRPPLYPGVSESSVHPLEAIPTHLCPKLVSCFGERLEILSLDRHHIATFLATLDEDIPLRLFNLDVEADPPLADFEWGSLISEALSLLGSRPSPPPLLRLPAHITVLEILLSCLISIDPPPILNDLRVLSLSPPSSARDLSLYSSPTCMQLEEECKSRGIELVLEYGSNSSGSPFVVEGFWSFVRRVERGEFDLRGEKDGKREARETRGC